MPSPLLTRSLFVLLIALLAACSDDSDNDGQTDVLTDQQGGDAGDASQDTQEAPACTADGACADTTLVCEPASQRCVERCDASSCATGEACDMNTGLCVAGAACSDTSPCADEGEVCDGCRGVCVSDEGKTNCTQDNNCLFEEYCEPCAGLCQPLKESCDSCVFDRECGDSDDRCIDLIEAGGRFCGQACGSVNDCPEGYLCGDGLGQCVPASGDCDAPAECDDDAECRGLDVICDRGRCRAGCDGPGSCPSSQVCEFGRCLAPCTERACDTPAMCDAPSGLCEIEGQCRDSSDCPESETFCDVAAFQCVPGCEDDNDCFSSSRICQNNLCVDRPCEAARNCAFEQFCDLSGGDCYPAEGPYCEMCDPDDDSACGGGDNQCIKLQDEDGNEIGAFCFLACEADPANLCPQGYACTPLQDQDGNPAGEVCYRDCTFDPWTD